MTRRTNRTLIQFGLEATYGGGVAGGSWADTDALVILNPKYRINRDVKDRGLIRPFLGGSDQLVGARRAILEFEVELAGTGVAGQTPAWGRLLRACAMTQGGFVGSRVEYTPQSTSLDSAAFRYIKDGMAYTSRGCRGTVQLSLPAFDIPRLKFTFWGIDAAAQVLAMPTFDYAPFRTPLVLLDASPVAAEMRVGCTYANGAITGGAVVPSRGLEIDLGNKLSHLMLLGAEEIDVASREVTGSVSASVTAADEVAWRTAINSNQLTSVGFTWGPVGSRVTVFMPSVQRIDPQEEDYEGRTLLKTELRLLPANGNDEIRVVAA